MEGNKIFIALNESSAPFAGCTSDKIHTESETIEISSATEQQWKEFISGRKRWSVSMGWLLTTVSNIATLPLYVGQRYNIKICSRGTSPASVVVRLTGYAICRVCEVTATRGSLIRGVFEFQGSGKLAPPTTT